MWQDVQLTSSGIGVKETEISEIELSRAAVSIAYAAVNSCKLLFEFVQGMFVIVRTQYRLIGTSTVSQTKLRHPQTR